MVLLPMNGFATDELLLSFSQEFAEKLSEFQEFLNTDNRRIMPLGFSPFLLFQTAQATFQTPFHQWFRVLEGRRIEENLNFCLKAAGPLGYSLRKEEVIDGTFSAYSFLHSDMQFIHPFGHHIIFPWSERQDILRLCFPNLILVLALFMLYDVLLPVSLIRGCL